MLASFGNLVCNPADELVSAHSTIKYIRRYAISLQGYLVELYTGRLMLARSSLCVFLLNS